MLESIEVNLNKDFKFVVLEIRKGRKGWKCGLVLKSISLFCRGF